MDKFVVFSDLHLHCWTYGSRIENGWNSRLIAQGRVLYEILNFCIDREVKHVFFCGDLFHTHQTLNAGPLTVACEAFARFKKAGIDVYFLIGNHDIASAKPLIHSLAPLWVYGHVVETGARIDIGDTQVNLLSYTKNRDTILEFLDGCEQDSLVFLHAGVQDVPLNSKGFMIKDEILAASDIPDRVKYAFTGHYHSHARVSDKLMIPGSPMQHTWADAGERRGWVYCHDNSHGFKTQLITSSGPQFIRGSEEEVLKKLQERSDYWHNLAHGDFVKIQAPVVNPALAERLMKSHSVGSVEFEIISEEVEQEVVDRASFNVSELVDSYIKDKNIDEATLDTGLAIMDGSYVID